MAWPNHDLDGVRFNQDYAGWNEIESIFIAIKERAVATGHSLSSGDYSGAFALELWHADPDGDTDRDYLKDLYEQFYTDLGSLVSGDSNIRWTETSGDTTEYTMTSLITAVALGDFADTLTRAANPEPLLWLRAALELLLYPKIDMDPMVGVGSYTRTESATSYTVGQDAWDHRADTTSTVSNPAIPGLKWNVTRTGFNYNAIIFDESRDVTFNTSILEGVLVTAFYEYSGLWDDVAPATSIDFQVGTETFTQTATHAAAYRETTDVVIGVDTEIDMDFVTAQPATIPFTLATGGAFLEFLLLSIRVHTDLSTILTDQA